MFEIVFWATAGVLLAGVIYFPHRWKKRRRLAMQAVAERLGWRWVAAPSEAAMKAYQRLDSFYAGRHHEIRNYLSGHRGGYTVAVFDLTYVTGTRYTRRFWKQTVVHLRSPALRLPVFTIQPETVMHRLGAVFGYQDIDLDEDFEFSSQYLLRGPDPSTVRLLMGDDARDFYRDNPGSCSEGRGPDLFFWEPVGLLPPHAVEAQVDLAIHLAHCLGTGSVPPRRPSAPPD